jgi:2-oxoglutarate dehydrogenase E2 component (dihydrolipoamide succinyltransferase)
MTDVKVPALAESVTEGEIGSWLKADGDVVARGEAILELQTDKASLEISAEVGGTLRHLRKEGETVRVGDVVGRIEEGATGAASARPATAPPVATPAAPAATPPAAAARQLGAPAPSTTPKAQPAPPAPAPSAPARPRPEEPGARRERMSLLRRRIAQRLVEAQHQAAILTTFNEVDMTEVMALRAKHQDWFTRRHGVKLGYMSLFSRAVIRALGEIAELNAFIDGEDVVFHDFVHLGIAVQTDRGLVVPVVRDAHAMGLGGIEKEIARLAALARAGKLSLEDMSGATFTISNGGVYGSLLSTPILTPPQTGILGMHAIQKRPACLEDGTIAARPMMYVALSYDHRLVDGKQAVTFLVRLKQVLEDPETSLLEA